MTAFENEENQSTTMFTAQIVDLAQPRQASSAISCAQLNGKLLPSFVDESSAVDYSSLKFYWNYTWLIAWPRQTVIQR